MSVLSYGERHRRDDAVVELYVLKVSTTSRTVKERSARCRELLVYGGQTVIKVSM
ncbi:hypothetical protein X739_00595 [Mesorhizobium sp. LNHC220B00]|nr:hypothetical protein X739_00595 [Mesorhizobium sp. LNHC220B00]